MQAQYSYQEELAKSERINWRIEDIIGGDKRLDFSKPFLPESLARVTGLTFLTPHEQMVVNQIRGHGYLATFGVVEEFILPFVLDHARPQLSGDDHRVRALLQFAAEEAKHIHLFKCFREDFAAGFGTPCGVIGPAEDIARAVLAHHPLAVGIAILGIEWMTQGHYVESVKDDQALDPQFASLLKHHWMEEAQHAKLDTLMVEALVDSCSAEEVSRAVDEYFEIGLFIDDGLKQQVVFDIDAFETATGRRLSDDERGTYTDVQHQAMRWTYLGSAMRNPNFLATLDRVGPGVRARVEDVAPAFC